MTRKKGDAKAGNNGRSPGDGVLKNYKIYVQPSTKRTLLIQYPNREPGLEYRTARGQRPLEMRVKPKTGMVEIDIPLNIHASFDSVKGLEYADAMRRSRSLQKGGSYGLAGGMGVGARGLDRIPLNPALPEVPSQEQLLENLDHADSLGLVMNKITLGGRIVPFKDGDPIYMTATFKEDICTWTKLDAMVQLRPQFDHLDAVHEKEYARRRKDRVTEEGAPERHENEPRTVNLTIKAAETTDELDMYGAMGETRNLLTSMRDELWQALEWVDQDENEAYEVYDDNLFYQDPRKATHLVSEMTNEQYLDAISCPRSDLSKQKGNEPAIGRSANVEIDSGDEHEDQDMVSFDEDVSHNDSTYSEVPEGIAVLNDVLDQIRVEKACQNICALAEAKQTSQEVALREKAKANPKLAVWAFLDPNHANHAFYQWRLAENRAGRGIQFDHR